MDNVNSYDIPNDSRLRFQLDKFLETWHDEIFRKNNTLRLVDDCFYRILSYLPVNDLCAVSETCRDFRRIAHGYVEKHSNRYFLDRTRFYGDRSTIKLNDTKRFIRNFGHCLTKLSLKSDEFCCVLPEEKPIRLLPVLDRYCTNLQDLEVNVSLASPKTIIPFVRLTSKLQRLTIIRIFGDRSFSSCRINSKINVESILRHCATLKHLELVGLTWIEVAKVYVAQRFETLESLSLRNTLLPRIDTFTAFLRENRHLKTLRLSACYFYAVEPEGFTFTLPPFNNLESFWLHSNDMIPWSMHLLNISGTMPALKQLCIDLNCFQESNLNSVLFRLAEHKVLQNVEILNANQFPYELDSHLSALTTLKRLQFTSVKGFTNKIIKTLACGLRNLTSVGFGNCDVDYDKIETFMEFSPSVRTIHLYTQVPHIGCSPPTNKILPSMVSARRRNRHNGKPLTLILNQRFLSDGGKMVEKGFVELPKYCANVIEVVVRVLPKAFQKPVPIRNPIYF